jgi:hypothetical protein
MPELEPLPRPTDVEQPKLPEQAASFVMRLAVSLVLPLWGLAMLVLGIQDGSIWWIGTGAVVLAIGALFLVGSPLADPIFRSSRSI